jgi:hypothetical protein
MEKQQSPDIQAQLNQARENLANLGNAVSELVNLSPDVFADEAIKTRLNDFQEAYEEATQRLANPSFRIATIGTTSSGKSTIVNALMGRRIAPIEAGEMSGGVLTLKHSEERKLVIESTPEAVWETGEWTNISDDELYSRIKNAMHSYHEARRKKEYIDIAPQIQVNTSLFPANDKNLSGLPEGIGIEFLDLPGLKSIQDKDNLAIIQSLVGKSFSLVALDYMQVDEQHRQKLLGELKRVVEYLYGRTDSMIFILNRVDQKSSMDDKPLEDRLHLLKTEIKEELNLKELPDIIPFNGRLLYYAQCAWGTNSLFSESSNVDQKTRQKLLKAMFEDCSGFIQAKIKTENHIVNNLPVEGVWNLLLRKNQDLTSWFRYIQDRLNQDKEIDDKTMKIILEYALKWSGGQDLWNCLQKRLKESFSELVIAPIFSPILTNFDVLLAYINVLIETRKFDNEQDIKEEIEKINKMRQDLAKKIETISSQFEQKIDGVIEVLKTENFKILSNISELNNKEFSFLYGVVKEIETDLNQSIIYPLLDAFNDNQPAYDVEDLFKEIIRPPLAEDIARYYDNVSRKIQKFSFSSDSFTKKAKISDEKQMKELEENERQFRLLCLSVDQIIKERIKFLIQVKQKEMIEGITKLLKNEVEQLNTILIDFNIPFQEVIITDFVNNVNQDFSSILENISHNISISKSQKQEREIAGLETYYVDVTKTKTETYTEYYQEGFLFFKKTKTRQKTRPVQYTEKETRTREITEYVDYFELSLPSFEILAKQWSQGITENKEILWDIFSNYIKMSSDTIGQKFQNSVIEITNLAERSFNQRLEEKELDFEEKQRLWNDFENQLNKVILDFQNISLSLGLKLVSQSN